MDELDAHIEVAAKFKGVYESLIRTDYLTKGSQEPLPPNNRYLEDGTDRLLEDGGSRYLEG